MTDALAVAIPPQSPADRQRIVDDVFADPAYDRYLENREVDLAWLEHALKVFKDALQWILDLGTRLGGLNETDPIIFWCIMGALLALLALLLWHIGYSVSMAFRRPAAGVSGTLKSEDEGPRRARAMVREAETLASRGMYTEALRNLLLAVVARTQEANMRLLAGWTNRELAGRIQIDPAYREPLERFVHTVDHVWYGLYKATAEDYRRSADFVEAYISGNAGGVQRDTDG